MDAAYQLRDYQQTLIQETFAKWRAGRRRVLLQLPTGASKTVLLSAIAPSFTALGEGVLVLAHREELLTQVQEKLQACTGQVVGIIKAGRNTSPNASIQVASVQTLIRRQFLPKASLLVIDEAHHSAADRCMKLICHYENAYTLGITATPARNDGQGFKFLYDALVLGPLTAELIAAGHLCRFKLFASSQVIKTAGVKVIGGDFNER